MATYTLIPGGGGDPWEWHRLVPELVSRGQHAIAVRLPAEDDTAGWFEYADAAVEAIGDRADVILVAASMDGFTAPIRSKCSLRHADPGASPKPSPGLHGDPRAHEGEQEPLQ